MAPAAESLPNTESAPTSARASAAGPAPDPGCPASPACPGWQDELERAAQLISDSDSINLVCHVGPDGDALGSLLALHHLARAQGVASSASWPEPFLVAPHYDYLPGLDLATKPADFAGAPGPLVTFDCGSLDRLVELGPKAEAAKDGGCLIVVDHHVTNECYGNVNVIDPSAAATAVVVRRLAARLGWPLNRDAAICLYTGLVTDTGRFQYSNTTPEVFALAQELAGFDLPIADMTRQLFETHRFAYLQMVAAALARAELDPELRFVATWITMDDFAHYGVSIEETEGLIDLVRRVGEAEVACVAKEVAGGVRVSLRSVSDIDVSAIACRFGGGGHRFAAGFTHPGPVCDTLDQIRRAVHDVVG